MEPTAIVGLVGCGVTFFVFGAQIIEAIHKKYNPPATCTKKALIGLKSSIQIMEKHIELICNLRSSTKHTIPKQLDSLLADCQQTGVSLLSLLKRIKNRKKTSGRFRLGMGRRIRRTQIWRVQRKLDKCQKLIKAEFDLLMLVPPEQIYCAHTNPSQEQTSQLIQHRHVA